MCLSNLPPILVGSVEGIGLPSIVCSFTTFWCLIPRTCAAYASAPVHVTSHSSQRSAPPPAPRPAAAAHPAAASFTAASFFLCFCPSRCSLYVCRQVCVCLSVWSIFESVCCGTEILFHKVFLAMFAYYMHIVLVCVSSEAISLDLDAVRVPNA